MHKRLVVTNSEERCDEKAETPQPISARRVLDEYEKRLYTMYKEKYEYGSTKG